MIPLQTARARTLLFMGLAVSLSACMGDAAGSADVIDHSVFVAVYVDLRAAALTTDEREITDEARAEVLSRHGASEASGVEEAKARIHLPITRKATRRNKRIRGGGLLLGHILLFLACARGDPN